VSVTLATCRSATAALADQSDLTYVDSTASNAGPGSIIATLSVAWVLDVTGETGDIEAVVFGVRGALLEGLGTIVDQHLKWTYGTETLSESVTLSGDPAAFNTVESAPQTEPPGGGTWDWQTVADLTAVGVESDVSLDAGESATLRVAEVYARVLGASGAEVMRAVVTVGDVAADALAGDMGRVAVAGDDGAEVLAGDMGRVVLAEDASGEVV